MQLQKQQKQQQQRWMRGRGGSGGPSGGGGALQPTHLALGLLGLFAFRRPRSHREPPPAFVCPITGEQFRDPVVCVSGARDAPVNCRRRCRAVDAHHHATLLQCRRYAA